MDKFKVADVSVDLESAEMIAVQSLEDVQKLRLFDHLTPAEKDIANQTLLDKVLPLNTQEED